MLNKNNSKHILSQLFDVKPMKNSVDLDWEAIKIVNKILDLKNVMTKHEVHIRRESLILRRNNTRDLRENESAVFVKDNKNDYQEKPVKIRQFFKESELARRSFSEGGRVYSQLLSDDYFAAIKKPKSLGDDIADINFGGILSIPNNSIVRQEISGELPLTQKDALRELENIDARDTSIEERYEISEDFNGFAIDAENIVNFVENNRDGARDYFQLPSLLFSKIRFNGLIVLVLAVFSIFSAVFFWDKTNNSGELISASSYQSIEIASSVRNSTVADNKRRQDNIGDFFSFLRKYGYEYLLIFQNSAEMRATGGLPEFYGIFSSEANYSRAENIENKTLANFSVNEILDFDAKLTENIIPPRPLQKISTSWGMHDANWFPDFPSSARQLSLFYKKINGETVDGVISFNSAFIADLLAITGPIKLDNYGEEIGVNNVANFLAQKTDNLKFLLKEEKNFFPYFARLLLDKIFLLDKTEREKIDAVLLDNLNKRNIQAFFSDAEAENIVLSNDWGGEMRAGDKDFLSVINSSIDGYKNDGNIKETINHESEIQSDGSIIDTVHVIKNYQNKNLDNKLFNLMDYNYLRVYVPFGSELLEAEGLSKEDYYAPIDYEKNNFQNDVQVSEIERGARFHESGAEIFKESGKTVFGGWVYVAPGRSISIKYKYKLPFKISKSGLPAGQAGDYSLTVRKQSGSMDSEFAGTIELPDNFIVKDKSDNLRDESGVYKITDNLDGDLEYGVSLTNF